VDRAAPRSREIWALPIFPAASSCLIDADVLVHPATLQLLLSPILEDRADAVVGNYSQDVSGHGFAAKYKQLYICCVYDRRAGYLYNDFWTAIGAIDASTFWALAGFDQSILGACGEDGELGVRLTAAGRRILGVPEATGRHLHKFNLRNLIVNEELGADGGGPRDFWRMSRFTASAALGVTALVGSMDVATREKGAGEH
jgi:hypothetical protein